MAKNSSKSGVTKPSRKPAQAKTSTPESNAFPDDDEQEETKATQPQKVETTPVAKPEDEEAAPVNFDEEIDTAFGGDLNDVFGEEDLFGGSEASLAELGLADPDGGEISSNLFRGGIPQNLQAPEPRPGYVQKYVRYLNRSGERDDKNITKNRRLGWMPRQVKPGEFALPTRSVGGSSIIIIDGLVLCEMPVERQKSIKRAYSNQTQIQNAAVEKTLRREGGDDHVPVGFTEQSQVRTGTRKPQVASNRGN